MIVCLYLILLVFYPSINLCEELRTSVNFLINVGLSKIDRAREHDYLNSVGLMWCF